MDSKIAWFKKHPRYVNETDTVLHEQLDCKIASLLALVASIGGKISLYNNVALS